MVLEGLDLPRLPGLEVLDRLPERDDLKIMEEFFGRLVARDMPTALDWFIRTS